ncbi:MAG TPA: MFS transporter, partial [Microthrixaceae bacterium]|nr:MFS transporter [Microthrixaceae bacterium]
MTGRDELAAHASRGKPRRNSGALTAALVGLVTVVALETMSVAAILPLVTAELGRIDLYGWVYSGLALGQIVGIVVAGRWADRANPSRPLVAGLALYVVGLSIAALAPSMVLLVAGRVVQGFGAGAVPSVVYVCVGRGFSEAERPRIFAMMSTAWVVPSLIGPVLASLVAESVGWRWVFAGVIPVAVVFGVVGRREILRLDASPNDGQPVDAVALGAMVVGTGVALGGFQARSGWLAAAM